jgi:hypothetical protein
MRKILIRAEIIWQVLTKPKLIFFSIKHKKDGTALISRRTVGLNGTKDDLARFLTNESGKARWGRIHVDKKNLKL